MFKGAVFFRTLTRCINLMTNNNFIALLHQAINMWVVTVIIKKEYLHKQSKNVQWNQNTAPDPQKIRRGVLPSQTMGSPGTLLLIGIDP